MELSKFEREMNIISALSDTPNENGLSAAELKAKFDEGGIALQAFINNNLIPALEEKMASKEDLLNLVVAKLPEGGVSVIHLTQELADIVTGAATTETYNAVIPTGVDAWTADETNGGYTVEVAVAGMLEADNPIADVVQGDDVNANSAIRDAFGFVTRITTKTDGIVIYASDIPAVNIPIQLKAVR